MRGGANAAAILDALGDPTRRVIFERLRSAASSVAALAQGLPVTRSAVSRHLRVLADAGLVRATAEGPRRIYSLCPKGLRPLVSWIEATPRAAAPPRGNSGRVDAWIGFPVPPAKGR